MRMTLPTDQDIEAGTDFRRTVNVRPLPQRDENGYGGFGYGGERLYVTWVADCFDPPVYAIRADNVSDAYDVALASLAPIVTAESHGYTEAEWETLVANYSEGEWAGDHYSWAPDGTLVDSEAVMLVLVKGESE